MMSSCHLSNRISQSTYNIVFFHGYRATGFAYRLQYRFRIQGFNGMDINHFNTVSLIF